MIDFFLHPMDLTTVCQKVAQLQALSLPWQLLQCPDKHQWSNSVVDAWLFLRLNATEKRLTPAFSCMHSTLLLPDLLLLSYALLTLTLL